MTTTIYMQLAIHILRLQTISGALKNAAKPLVIMWRALVREELLKKTPAVTLMRCAPLPLTVAIFILWAMIKLLVQPMNSGGLKSATSQPVLWLPLLILMVWSKAILRQVLITPMGWR